MPTKPTIRRYELVQSGHSVLWDQSEGTYSVSPRVNGKLRLRANACNLSSTRTTSFEQVPGRNGEWTVHHPGAMVNPGFSWTRADNQAYSRFWGKVRKGSASMGVTLASWKQSRQMITDRLRKTSVNLEDTYRMYKRSESKLKGIRRRRSDKELLANDVLEYKFGWKPLFDDLHAALFTVCKDGIPPQWVTARGKITDHRVLASGNDRMGYRDTLNSRLVTTYSARVNISNPNVWLLNRMGLINPATIAWDLVPWSFVVNMFVNVNSMISSVTNEIGLDVTDYSITRSRVTFCERYREDRVTRAVCRSNNLTTTKVRTIGAQLLPKWEVQVPDLDWDLAVTAASLAVQKVKRLNRLLGI